MGDFWVTDLSPVDKLIEDEVYSALKEHLESDDPDIVLDWLIPALNPEGQGLRPGETLHLSPDRWRRKRRDHQED